MKRKKVILIGSDTHRRLKEAAKKNKMLMEGMAEECIEFALKNFKEKIASDRTIKAGCN